jgi:hypothetical protein
LSVPVVPIAKASPDATLLRPSTLSTQCSGPWREDAGLEQNVRADFLQFRGVACFGEDILVCSGQ